MKKVWKRRTLIVSIRNDTRFGGGVEENNYHVLQCFDDTSNVRSSGQAFEIAYHWSSPHISGD